MTARREPPPLDRLVAVPVRRDGERRAAADLLGTNLDGRRVRVAVSDSGRWTLLLFLASDCEGCGPFWPLVAGAVDQEVGVDHLIAIVRDDRTENPDHLHDLVTATAADRVVMSNDAWRDYGVLGPPFAVLVDGRSGTVATETVAWSTQQVAADVERARAQVREGSSTIREKPSR